jgi:hypothetical protein
MSWSRNLAQSYAGMASDTRGTAPFSDKFVALPARTRLKFSLAVCTVAITGWVVSDYLEKMYPPPPTAKNDTH